MRLGLRFAAGFLLLARSANVLAAAAPWPPDGVTIRRDLHYRTTADRSCTLDLALPKDDRGPLRPAIFVIHGGGWIEGDKSSFSTAQTRTPGNILDFAALGFVAATVNYRLSKEAPYPAALHDCRDAVRWLRAHAAEYHVDPERIGAYGNSAGGHLALLLGMTDEPAAELSNGTQARFSGRVQAIVSDSGPIDLLWQHQHKALTIVVERFLGGPPIGARLSTYVEASPSHYASPKLSKKLPLLLIYGEADEQVDVQTADRFVADLSGAGHTDVSYFRLAAVGHCPHSLKRIPFLRQVVLDFFLRTLGDPRR